MLINSPSRMIGSRTASASITSQTLTGLSQFSQYTVEVTSLVNGRRGDISPPVTFTVNCPSDNNNINNSKLSPIIPYACFSAIDVPKILMHFDHQGLIMFVPVWGALRIYLL